MLLTVDRSIAADRFRSRRGELQALSAQHPERDVDDDSVDEIVTDALLLSPPLLRLVPERGPFRWGVTLHATYQVLLADAG